MADFTWPHPVSRLAFGSCNRQWMDQSVWSSMAATAPDAGILGGDAWYTSRKAVKGLDPHSLEALRYARLAAEASPELQHFRNVLKAPLMATCDDHDRGVNDGGGGDGYLLGTPGVADRTARRDEFLAFLGAADDDPRRHRGGLYASYTLGEGARRVKVILLDTRFWRDDFVIPTLVQSTIGGVISRGLAAATGIVDWQDGTLLGEQQWKWLESQFEDSKEHGIAVNLLVSSIQVFTSNPLLEGWGHYPKERKRLVRLLQRYNPSGLAILSGDVHVGEILHAEPDLEAIEVTSSGITHDCTDGGIPRFVCEGIFSYFSAHRSTSFPSVYAHRNFGTIDIDWATEEQRVTSGCAFRSLNISVHDANGNARQWLHRDRCGLLGVALTEHTDFGAWAFRSPAERATFCSMLVVCVLLALIVAWTAANALRKQCQKSWRPKPKHE